jgi:anti-sigma-K factor RskA
VTACGQGESVGAYLLGALPEEEHAAFVTHLPACVDCSRDVAELQVVVDTLPLAAPQVAPPPELRDRIMTVVRSEAELLAAAGPEADRSRERPARRGRWRRQVLALRPLPAALVAGVLVAVGVAGGVALSSGDGGRTVPGQVHIASAPTARASLFISDGSTRLHVRNMPPPPPGKVYEIWLKRGSAAPAPTTALFMVDRAGRADVNVPGAGKDVDQVLVTAEPDGGSQVPTSAPVIVASTA